MVKTLIRTPSQADPIIGCTYPSNPQNSIEHSPDPIICLSGTSHAMAGAVGVASVGCTSTLTPNCNLLTCFPGPFPFFFKSLYMQSRLNAPFLSLYAITSPFCIL